MSNKLKELLARVPKETYDKVSKQMTCAYYFNGDAFAPDGTRYPDPIVVPNPNMML